MNIEPFDPKYIPELVRWVSPLWSMMDWDTGTSMMDWDAGVSEKSANKKQDLDVEFIVRHNIFYNEFALQLVQGEELQAVAFAAGKEEENHALQWLEANNQNLSANEQESLQQVVDYLEQMDEKTCGCMEQDAVRLTLFASSQRGCGSMILQQLEERLRRAGFKAMYLWTDSDCNHQWYPKHGFTLVESEVNKSFSTPEKNFMTYIFCKKL
ncbi:MAG: hypothetical protein J6V63_07940 [Spirochaetaceae bacterium]|nr:hypothetical protein [Spirochaetaceae bacterium]